MSILNILGKNDRIGDALRGKQKQKLETTVIGEKDEIRDREVWSMSNL